MDDYKAPMIKFAASNKFNTRCNVSSAISKIRTRGVHALSTVIKHCWHDNHFDQIQIDNDNFSLIMDGLVYAISSLSNSVI